MNEEQPSDFEQFERILRSLTKPYGEIPYGIGNPFTSAFRRFVLKRPVKN